MCKEFWGPEKKPCTPLYLKGDLEVSKYPNSLTTIGHHHSLVFSYKIQPKKSCTKCMYKYQTKNNGKKLTKKLQKNQVHGLCERHKHGADPRI